MLVADIGITLSTSSSSANNTIGTNNSNSNTYRWVTTGHSYGIYLIRTSEYDILIEQLP